MGKRLGSSLERAAEDSSPHRSRVPTRNRLRPLTARKDEERLHGRFAFAIRVSEYRTLLAMNITTQNKRKSDHHLYLVRECLAADRICGVETV